MKNRQTKKPDPGKIPKPDRLKMETFVNPAEKDWEDQGANPDQIKEVFLDQIVALKRIIEKMQGNIPGSAREESVK